MIKVLANVGIATSNIIQSREKLEETTLKSGMIQGCPLYPVLSNIVLNILTTIIRQEKEIKWIKIRKEQIKGYLFTDNIIPHTRDPKHLAGKF